MQGPDCLGVMEEGGVDGGIVEELATVFPGCISARSFKTESLYDVSLSISLLVILNA